MKILIKNGLIYDGTGNAPVKKDIVIQNGKIARLGSFPKKDASLVIDATGMAITPGLIDINFKSGSFEKMIRGGVTTAIGLADEFLETLGKKHGLMINLGRIISYVGVRQFFAGGDGRDLTVREEESLKNVFSKAFKDGAFGLSLPLDLPYANRIPMREVLEAAKIAAKFGRVCALRPRYTDERLMAGLEEILEIGRDAGASVEINHLEPLSEFSGFYEDALKVIEKKAAQSHVGFDVYPEGVTFMPIHSFLPDWLFAGDIKETLKSLKEKTVKDRVLRHIQKMKIDGIVIAEAPTHLKFLEGKSLDDFARNHGLTKVRALFRLMIISEFKMSVFRRSVDKKILEKYLENPRTIISLGLENLIPRGEKESFFARIKKSGNPALEKAVAKTTGLPAAKYKIEKRGFIKENYWADLVLWENWKPGTVLVNGVIAMRDGEIVNKKTGLFLKAN